MRKFVPRWSAFLMAATLTALLVGGGPAFAQDADKDRYASTVAATMAQPVSPSKLYPFSALKKAIGDRAAINKDVVGYLIVPNTNINMPITAAPAGSNKNEYYEKRDWRGTLYPNNSYSQYANTATYLDYRTHLGTSWREGTSRNIVIYGHNWSNLRTPYDIGGEYSRHIMFGQLPSYTDINFARQNPYIYFSTNNMEGVWKVFAVGYAEVKPSFPYNVPNPPDYSGLLTEWKQRSMFNFNVDVAETDRILTLSTCIRQYSSMGPEQRFVVVARLLRPGETESDPVAISVNQNQKQPQF